MRVHLLVQRDADDHSACWVIDAADEYTLDEWHGGLPDEMQAKVDADPVNVRQLIVTIPDGALALPWATPTVAAEVSR